MGQRSFDWPSLFGIVYNCQYNAYTMMAVSQMDVDPWSIYRLKKRLFVCLFVYLFVCCCFFKGVCGGIVRGSGRQTIGVVLNFISYCVVGLPLGIALMFLVYHDITGKKLVFLYSKFLPLADPETMQGPFGQTVLNYGWINDCVDWDHDWS